MEELKSRKRRLKLGARPIHLLWVLVLVLGSACHVLNEDINDKYPEQFGEIYFDAALDNPDFKLCDSTTLVHSRVSLSYEGGRMAIEERMKAMIREDVNAYSYEGYIVVRFLVNCRGEVGRVRLESLDDAFVLQPSPEGLMKLVERSVKTLDNWIVTIPKNEGKDHSKYFNLKIINGQIDAVIH